MGKNPWLSFSGIMLLHLIPFCSFTLPGNTMLCLDPTKKGTSITEEPSGKTAAKELSVYDLRINLRNNPVGTGGDPRFSWKINNSERNTFQTAYAIRVTSGLSAAKLIWESGKTVSEQSLLVPYRGPDLLSGQKYHWQVKIWDNRGRESSWSDEEAYWRTGLLKKSDWQAKWIEGTGVTDSVNGPALYFRKSFHTSGKIISAILYITAHGMYEAYINEKRVGDAYFTPGWTSYDKRIQYQAYDVTSLLQSGENAIGAALGSGWFRTDVNRLNVWGKKLALLAQLEIKYAGGKKETLITDNGWKCTDQGPIRFSELYDGEIYDGRMEMEGWSGAGFDDREWHAVVEKDYGIDKLVETENQPVRKHEVLLPEGIFRTPKGELVADFGQNLVGWVQLNLTGKPGTEIVITHAEVLDKEGNFYTENLRGAEQQNTCILKGKGTECFEPHFTFQGFRYIRIEGYPGNLKPENIKAVAMYSDMETTGAFTCSDSLVNQLQQNIQWTQKGNFVDVPTDCPQRDERLGWTGDAQLFSRTAMFNMHVYNFFVKWLMDLAADQSPEGAVPPVVPNILENFGSSAGWADAATIIPWNLYLVYGDEQVLKDQYNSMRSWINYILSKSSNHLWDQRWHFGDWLFYRPEDDRSGRSAVTDKQLIAQCYFARSTRILIRSAEILGKKEDVSIYSDHLAKIKKAFLREYVTPNGKLVSGTQTAYALALRFDLLPEEMRGQAAERLVENIREYGHVTTGILGTAHLFHVLNRFGYTGVAYELFLRKKYPSWLYAVKKGATTTWERWDGIKPDSTFQNPEMNSFNHYALGSIGDWMYRTIAGIDTDPGHPGYKKSVIRPIPGGRLTRASAVYRSVYGTLASGWEIKQGRFTHRVTVPPNTSARVYLRTDSAQNVREGGRPLTGREDINILGKEEGSLVVEIGSGEYQFLIE